MQSPTSIKFCFVLYTHFSVRLRRVSCLQRVVCCFRYGQRKHVEAMKVDAINVAHLEEARLKAR